MVKKKNKYKRKSYPYRNRDGYLKTGVSALTSTMAVGMIPNVSGTTAETTVKEKFGEGMAKFSTVFPAMGKMVGTSMVLKQVGKLKKASNKLTKKRKKDLI